LHLAALRQKLIQFLRLVGKLAAMTKTFTVEAQRHNAERQLFTARRALSHLVEMYENGQWRVHYKKEDAFVEAVRQARQAVEHWTNVFSKTDSKSTSA
jgi:hypothetical protein